METKEESILYWLPADILAILFNLTGGNLAILDKRTHEKLEHIKIFPRLKKATTERREAIIKEIEKEIESWYSAILESEDKLDTPEVENHNLLFEFKTFIQKNLYISGAPEPPTLHFMNIVLDESNRMLQAYHREEGGVQELRRLIFNRVYIWSKQNKHLTIIEQKNHVALTVTRIESEIQGQSGCGTAVW